jgi:hypothetical protein
MKQLSVLEPNTTYAVEEATRLNGSPISRSPIADTASIVAGSDLEFTFELRPRPMHFHTVSY